ncbi:hypothetical protein ABT008_25115 [Micromonospora sp. NPDC002389]
MRWETGVIAAVVLCVDIVDPNLPDLRIVTPTRPAGTVPVETG